MERNALKVIGKGGCLAAMLLLLLLIAFPGDRAAAAGTTPFLRIVYGGNLDGNITPCG